MKVTDQFLVCIEFLLSSVSYSLKMGWDDASPFLNIENRYSCSPLTENVKCIISLLLYDEI